MRSVKLFEDRFEAGRALSKHVRVEAPESAIVLALPRGGVPVAAPIAERLGIPLEILVVRKIASPSHSEYGIGALAEGGLLWIDEQRARAAGVDLAHLESYISKEREELQRRVEKYRQGRALESLEGRTVLIVDDGLATGVTARIACQYARRAGAKKVILAVPVCCHKSYEALRNEYDEIICLKQPGLFFSVGQFYSHFSDVPEEEIISLLQERHLKSSTQGPERNFYGTKKFSDRSRGQAA